jgi:predicted RNase H-like HicB family nuclease
MHHPRPSKKIARARVGEGRVNNIPKYQVTIYWSKADDCYLAEVPELPGCMADGKTIKEVAANVEVIIQEWIECALLDGEPIPESKCKETAA